MISEQEFNDWLLHPVTVEFRKVLAEKRAGLREEWEQSEPLAYTKESFVLANVGNIGWCRGLAWAESLEYEQYLTEIGANDGKSVGVGTSGSRGPHQDVRTGEEGSTDRDS